MQFTIEELIREVVRKENKELISEIKKVMQQNKSETSSPMNTEKAIAYLNCSKSYLYKMTSQNKIPHSKRGKKIFFQKEVLDSWLLENKIKTEDEIHSLTENFLFSGNSSL